MFQDIFSVQKTICMNAIQKFSGFLYVESLCFSARDWEIKVPDLNIFKDFFPLWQVNKAEGEECGKKESQSQHLSWKSPLEGFRVGEAIIQRLICWGQNCNTYPITKRGRGEVLGMWHTLWSKGVNTHPPSHKLTQLQIPHPRMATLWGTFTWGQLRGCHPPSKTPKVLPTLIAEALRQSTACDSKRCNRARVCCRRLCPTFPPRWGGTPPGPNVLIHRTLCFEEPSPPGRPEEEDQ